VSASNEDFLFAQQAQALGYVTEAQIEEAFRLQRIMAQDLKIDERLEGILLKRGWLADDQARRVRARLEPEGGKNEIEGYRLLEKIGRGAMGTVYKAMHLGLQRHVAVKVLHQDLAADSTQVERLKAEAKLLASLDHPNILRALDAGESNGFPFVVTEYVEGETLRERIAREGPLPESEALEIARSIADALEKARRMGVVHRDVKPGNVLLSRQGQPKLMDLGLAKGPVDTGLTQHGATVGTPQYISPEQAQDPRKADTRSDIYSLGATLYAFVTGRPPFEGTTLAEVLTKVLYETPTPPRVLNPKVSAETGYLIERMMLKDPGLRYHTPADVVTDIERILAGRSIMPAGFRGNWEAFLLRKRIRRVTVVGGVVVVLLGAGAFAVQAYRTHLQEKHRREVAVQRIGDTLPLLAYGPEDTRESVEDKRDRARELLSDVQGLDLREVVELQQRLRELTALDQSFDKWYALLGGPGEPKPDDGGPVVSALREKGDYKTALSRLDGFQRVVSPVGTANPIYREIDDWRRLLRLESLEAWHALDRAAHTGSEATLQAWVQRFLDFKERAQRGFVPEPDVTDGIERAQKLASAARSIELLVLKHEAAYEPSTIAARLALQDPGPLLATEIPEAEAEIDRNVQRLWGENTEYAALAVLIGPDGLVKTRLAATSAAAHARVEEYTRLALAQISDLIHDGRLEAAEAALDALISRLGRVGAAAQQGLANSQLQGLAQLQRQRGEAQVAAHRAIDDRVLTALRTLDAGTPEAVRRAARLSADEQRLLGDRPVAVERLEGLAAAVERLFDLAMEELERLKVQRQRLDPKLRSGASVERKWLIAEVQREARTFDLSAGGTQGREPRARSLFELAPEQIVWLAQRQSPRPGDRMALALGALALLPDPMAESQPDPTQALAAYVAARPVVDVEILPPVLRDQFHARRARLESEVRADEQTAIDYHARMREALAKGDWSSANFFLEELLEPGRLRSTRYVAQHVADLQDAFALVDSNIENDSMERVMPGTRARRLPPGNRWEITYDFDTDIQIGLKNFVAGQGVLEPVDGLVVTPDATRTQQRLHLLKGFDEPARDLPLVWASIFDPAEAIIAEFDCFASERPFLLAVDIDGLQVAILSLDPRWHAAFRLDPAAPELEGEKKRPVFDGLGRGRGVAFHEGVDFGDIQGWKGSDGKSAWPDDGRGLALLDDDLPTNVSGPLYGLPPRQSQGPSIVKVKVVREGKRMSLFIDDKLVAREERDEWGRRGTQSERQPAMRNGTGTIRILTYTPLAIDNLRLTGTVRSTWLEAQRAEREKKPEQPR
jgi:tRNA A-37 threonylcarbamoyl transferase component Bud32